MKNKSKKNLSTKRILSLFLVGVLIVSNFTGLGIPAFAMEKNQVNVSFESTYNEQENIEIISLTAFSFGENVVVTGIELPDETFVAGSTAQYVAEENRNYDFVVHYEETMAASPSMGNETITEDETIDQNEETIEDEATSLPDLPEQTVEEGSKVFTYKVVKLAAEEKEISPAKETATNSGMPLAATPDQFFTFNPTTQTIIGYTSSLSAPKDIVIPEQIGGVDVLHIGDNAFSGQQLTSMVLNSQIQTIGNAAFRNNPAVTEILLPNTVTSIGNRAFADCIGLTNMVIPNGVTAIEEATFYGNSGLTSITLPAALESIGNEAFNNARKLTNIVVPNTVTSIGRGAFSYCNELTSVTLPNGITSISDSLFAGCKKLASICFRSNENFGVI